ncbi:UNVERIFIED_CONTAM: hypothetical protein Sradi_0719200 [Sesamum radiatum]|uniref:Uncharacterized protein n=1 Tax=Sesamum radiatum TaxID=300843 RepID=A0AAW2VN73_SESRA
MSSSSGTRGPVGGYDGSLLEALDSDGPTVVALACINFIVPIMSIIIDSNRTILSSMSVHGSGCGDGNGDV